MSPWLMYHWSPAENRESILERGLEARRPAEHHYPSLVKQPRGVYTAVDEDRWRWHGYDCWQVTWCGPAIHDPILALTDRRRRALVIEEDVPPQQVLLHGAAPRRNAA